VTRFSGLHAETRRVRSPSAAELPGFIGCIDLMILIPLATRYADAVAFNAEICRASSSRCAERTAERHDPVPRLQSRRCRPPGGISGRLRSSRRRGSVFLSAPTLGGLGDLRAVASVTPSASRRRRTDCCQNEPTPSFASMTRPNRAVKFRRLLLRFKSVRLAHRPRRGRGKLSKLILANGGCGGRRTLAADMVPFFLH